MSEKQKVAPPAPPEEVTQSPQKSSVFSPEWLEEVCQSFNERNKGKTWEQIQAEYEAEQAKL